MERPTCKTCPYWEELEISEPDNPKGDCHRNPPQFAGSDYQMEEWRRVAFGYWEGSWPETHGDHGWCGEHPDFPVYIASLKTEPEEPKTIFVCRTCDIRFVSKVCPICNQESNLTLVR